MIFTITNKQTIYYRIDGLGQGPTIRSLFMADPSFPRRLDAESIRQFMLDSLQPGRTFFEGIARHEPDPPLESIEDAIAAISRHTIQDDRLGIALLLNSVSAPDLSWLQKDELKNIPVFAPSTIANLQSQNAPNLTIVDSNETRFIAALPDTISAVEAPIDTLLPVTATLVARAMKQAGIDRAIAIHEPNIDRAYIAAVFRSIGLQARSLCRDATTETEPFIDLSCYERPQLFRQLASELELPLNLSTPRQHIIETTLCLLHTQMTGQLLKERRKIKERETAFPG